MERFQKQVLKMIRRLRCKPCDERLKELGMFHLEKRRLGGNMITILKYLKGCHKEKGEKLFSLTAKSRTGDNGFKPLQKKCRLNLRKKKLPHNKNSRTMEQVA